MQTRGGLASVWHVFGGQLQPLPCHTMWAALQLTMCSLPRPLCAQVLDLAVLREYMTTYVTPEGVAM